jgi:hypothetical protein
MDEVRVHIANKISYDDCANVCVLQVLIGTIDAARVVELPRVVARGEIAISHDFAPSCGRSTREIPLYSTDYRRVSPGKGHSCIVDGICVD